MKNRYNNEYAKTSWDAIVIGSGIGSLSTAVFLAKDGKRVLVLEKHYKPGGFSHTFRRNGYFWDVGVHYVGQVHNEGSMLRKIFDYLTDGKLKWADMGEVYDVAYLKGERFDFKSDAKAQMDQLLELFPEDRYAILHYFKLIKKVNSRSIWFFSEKTMPPWLSNTLGRILRSRFRKYSDKTTLEVLKTLTSNEKLIALLTAQCGNYGLSPSQSSFAVHAMVIDHYMAGGNYPVGGADSICNSLIEVLEKNGGRLAVNSGVEKVVVSEGKAIGVKIENGDVIRGKWVISGAGAQTTFRSLLPDMDQLMYQKKEVLGLSPSISHACLYLGMAKSDEELGLPKHNVWIYDEYPIEEAFERHFSKAPWDSPVYYVSFPSAKDPQWRQENPGKSTIQIICSLPFDAVEKWGEQPWMKRGEDYENIKSALGQKLLQVLLKHFPQLDGNIAHMEVSTPLSTRHFMSHQRGEIYGLDHSPMRFRTKNLRPKTKLKNFFLTGQDIVTVGVGGALFSGVITAVSILNKNLLWRVLRNRAKHEKIS